MGLEIVKAEKGKYFVRRVSRGDGLYVGVEFAGSLDKCLAFVRSYFEPKQEGETK